MFNLFDVLLSLATKMCVDLVLSLLLYLSTFIGREFLNPFTFGLDKKAAGIFFDFNKLLTQ